MEKPYTENRKARHEYEILETLEGGLVLSGPETKSIREGGAKLDGSYIQIMSGELWLVAARIAPYSKQFQPELADPTQRRKILIQKRELRHLAGKIQQKGLTLVPLSFYPKGRRIKVPFALCRGKQAHNKREKLKERDIQRQTTRFLRGKDD